MNYYVLNIFEGRSGYGVTVRCDDISEEDKTYYVSAHYIKRKNLSKGAALSEEELEDLSHTHILRRAVLKAADILASGDYSKIRLTSKLTEKGFDRDIALEAAKYMEERGYIKEKEQAARLALYQAEVKLRGKKRIMAELSAKGYGKTAINHAIAEIPPEVYYESLLALIKQKYKTPAADRRENDRRVAALMRCGFETSDILRALRAYDEDLQNNEY